MKQIDKTRLINRLTRFIDSIVLAGPAEVQSQVKALVLDLIMELPIEVAQHQLGQIQSMLEGGDDEQTK